ncbi:MAG TPA: helix-turn-helix domain-containing protein [Pseudonocardiaceae bacterium]|nr:helix-turn-helix domain-containing protein [Pseudonocardiaceae bacterium]
MTSGAKPVGMGFRDRLLDGLAHSIRERGFHDTTIADIVRGAHTSRRTFYDEFPSKEACFLALLRSTNDVVARRIAAAVDPSASLRTQVRQAIESYLDSLAYRPEITLSWIRELPALGTIARDLQREMQESMVELTMRLSAAAGIEPVSRQVVILLLGGLRELVAVTVEDGTEVHEVSDVAIDATLALLGLRDSVVTER